MLEVKEPSAVKKYAIEGMKVLVGYLLLRVMGNISSAFEIK